MTDTAPPVFGTEAHVAAQRQHLERTRAAYDHAVVIRDHVIEAIYDLTDRFTSEDPTPTASDPLVSQLHTVRQEAIGGVVGALNTVVYDAGRRVDRALAAFEDSYNAVYE